VLIGGEGPTRFRAVEKVGVQNDWESLKATLEKERRWMGGRTCVSMFIIVSFSLFLQVDLRLG
jgi:hypothetical protein